MNYDAHLGYLPFFKKIRREMPLTLGLPSMDCCMM
jgi:hypothetical protein